MKEVAPLPNPDHPRPASAPGAEHPPAPGNRAGTPRVPAVGRTRLDLTRALQLLRGATSTGEQPASGAALRPGQSAPSRP